MEDTPLLDRMSGPEDEMVTDLFSAESQFVSENLPLKSPVAVKHEEDEFHILKDAYLGAADPREPLLHTFNPPLSADCKNKVKVELLVDENEDEEVEIKEAGGSITSNNLEEATFQSPLAQESCGKFSSSQEREDASGCSQKDSNPMVICQLKGGTQMLCIDNSGTRELKALHLVPQYQDQNNYLQSDAPKPMTTLVGRFLPVPAKLNLITQQLDNTALPSVVSGSAFPSGSTLPGPPNITLAGYCDCFAGGDFCNNCNCNNCCNNLRHEIERFKAIKACLDRNPEAFQPKIGKGKLGDAKPRHSKGCSCRRSGCLKNYCECYEAKTLCSSICKCIGCKNYEESPERKTLINMPNYMEVGGFEGSHHLSPTKFSGLPKFRRDRPSSSCISWEVVEATCACLLAQGEEAEKERRSKCLAEQMILEEFGRCLSQILHIEFKSKGLKVE
ncbi:tesmin isoform X2 [Vicugna pacos]|uniref:Tesmin isoform X2 n=1 Tax=Vicugna pacos TaxID=30538 RepID=A0ABM5E0A7_VICPA